MEMLGDFTCRLNDIKHSNSDVICKVEVILNQFVTSLREIHENVPETIKKSSKYPIGDSQHIE